MNDVIIMCTVCIFGLTKIQVDLVDLLLYDH